MTPSGSTARAGTTGAQNSSTACVRFGPQSNYRLRENRAAGTSRRASRGHARRHRPPERNRTADESQHPKAEARRTLPPQTTPALRSAAAGPRHARQLGERALVRQAHVPQHAGGDSRRAVPELGARGREARHHHHEGDRLHCERRRRRRRRRQRLPRAPEDRRDEVRRPRRRPAAPDGHRVCKVSFRTTR